MTVINSLISFTAKPSFKNGPTLTFSVSHSHLIPDPLKFISPPLWHPKKTTLKSPMNPSYCHCLLFFFFFKSHLSSLPSRIPLCWPLSLPKTLCPLALCPAFLAFLLLLTALCPLQPHPSPLMLLSLSPDDSQVNTLVTISRTVTTMFTRLAQFCLQKSFWMHHSHQTAEVPLNLYVLRPPLPPSELSSTLESNWPL